jgi:hypothetical protein
MDTETCGKCGKLLEPRDTIHVADLGPRCFTCHNQELAGRLGVRFDDTPLDPIVVNDAEGAPHTLAIRSLLVPTGREMTAREVQPQGGGYEFSVLGDFDADAWRLFTHLYEKIRREIAVKHVEMTEFGWHLTAADRFAGRIEWDDDSGGETPIVVIDGKPFTWDELGRILTTYEGFTLHARIEDSIEIVGGPLLEKGPEGKG